MHEGFMQGEVTPIHSVHTFATGVIKFWGPRSSRDLPSLKSTVDMGTWFKLGKLAYL